MQGKRWHRLHALHRLQKLKMFPCCVRLVVEQTSQLFANVNSFQTTGTCTVDVVAICWVHLIIAMADAIFPARGGHYRRASCGWWESGKRGANDLNTKGWESLEIFKIILSNLQDFNLIKGKSQINWNNTARFVLASHTIPTKPKTISASQQYNLMALNCTTLSLCLAPVATESIKEITLEMVWTKLLQQKLDVLSLKNFVSRCCEAFIS